MEINKVEKERGREEGRKEKTCSTTRLRNREGAVCYRVALREMYQLDGLRIERTFVNEDNKNAEKKDEKIIEMICGRKRREEEEKKS